MKSRHHRDRAKERARNIFLVILAVGLVVIFFNLDVMRKGESVFSKNADRKLRFAGQLARKSYAAPEIDRLLAFIRRYDKDIESLTVRASTQDAYGKIDRDTSILFELQMVMADGATIDTPVRRSPRGQLVSAILEKLNKDMKAYLSLKKRGKDVDTLLNVM
ncbi:hypothetical protein [Pseudodesulfovibrio sp.]|uniref:hypothetical protein n=1 Tax=Pseudodesulfovibrio sp. TaxID=2035812 RepID=UPI002631C90C|nr:hypothetical protein [Pseudodesulfovibrio sp.]MDD3312237.1 hypothetical protein [Pseudodesulfovibrio sp.]